MKTYKEIKKNIDRLDMNEITFKAKYLYRFKIRSIFFEVAFELYLNLA